MKNSFKHLVALGLFTVLSAIFLSCKDESDEIEINETHLTGETWTYSKVESDAPGAELLATFFAGYQYTFNEGGTYVSYDAIFDFEEEGTWEYENDQLLLDAGSEFEEKYEVTELSESTLKLFQTVEDDETGGEFDLTLVFKR